MNKLLLSLILAFSFNCFDVKAQQVSPSPESRRSDGKLFEEYRRKVAEVEEKNKKISENNRKINQALAEGAAAYNNKNYRLALEKFDEGYNLDPDFWGTAPVLLNNKAMALTQLGVEVYNYAVKTKKNPKPESNRFFLDAVLALKASQKILETAALPTDEAARVSFEQNRYISFKQLAECYRLLVLTDETRIYEAIEAFENYIKIESDNSLKQKAQEKLKALKSKYKINN
jgi:tetratricopeptide (TPR) repeat protein